MEILHAMVTGAIPTKKLTYLDIKSADIPFNSCTFAESKSIINSLTVIFTFRT